MVKQTTFIGASGSSSSSQQTLVFNPEVKHDMNRAWADLPDAEVASYKAMATMQRVHGLPLQRSASSALVEVGAVTSASGRADAMEQCSLSGGPRLLLVESEYRALLQTTSAATLVRRWRCTFERPVI